MAQNPYAWHLDHPRRRVPRAVKVAEVVEHLRRGAAVKVIGGRGMGKSVLLQQIEEHLRGEPGTRVVLVPGPPEEGTVAGAVRDLAARLGVRDLPLPRIDDLLDRVLTGSVMRLVVLFDETDQYVRLGGGEAAFARSWFNKLEVTRKQYDTLFDVVFAGGLGLFYLEREIGSGIVSRAEPCVLSPFDGGEIAGVAAPFAEAGRTLDDACLETLRALSGGSPALVTYGLQNLWDTWDTSATAAPALEQIFGLFRERHDSFVRAVHASVSESGRLDAPWRVLEVVRADAGSVPMPRLRDACVPRPGERVSIDPVQALKLLCAAGLVRIEGLLSADPVAAWPVASILNLPEVAASSGEPVERLIQDVAAVLSNLHRFGRDFHGKNGLLHEDIYSSMIAVGLRLLGWAETDREAVQAAGYTDLKVRLVNLPHVDAHVLIEAKLWHGDYNKGIQKQLDDYRISDTRHGIAVTLGVRDPDGWPEDYEQTCLAERSFVRLSTPPDLVGRWTVRGTTPEGREWVTDHLLVQIPKRR